MRKKLVILICNRMLTISEVVLAIEHAHVDKDQEIECIFDLNSTTELLGERFLP